MSGLSDSKAAGNTRVKLRRVNDDGTSSEVTFLKDSEDLQWAMDVRDENGECLYDKSAAYRESIKDLVAASPALMSEPTLARRSPIPDDATMLQGMREDAIRQQHDRAIEAFGGTDLVGKYQIAEQIVTAQGDDYDAFSEMQQLTEPDRPHENYLKQRKAAGAGPLQWKMSVDADKAIGPSDEQVQGNEPIIQIEES